MSAKRNNKIHHLVRNEDYIFDAEVVESVLDRLRQLGLLSDSVLLCGYSVPTERNDPPKRTGLWAMTIEEVLRTQLHESDTPVKFAFLSSYKNGGTPVVGVFKGDMFTADYNNVAGEGNYYDIKDDFDWEETVIAEFYIDS